MGAGRFRISAEDQALITRYIGALRKEQYAEASIGRIQLMLRKTATLCDLMDLTDEEIEEIANTYANRNRVLNGLRTFNRWVQDGDIPSHYSSTKAYDTEPEDPVAFRSEWKEVTRKVLRKIGRPKDNNRINFRDSHSLQYWYPKDGRINILHALANVRATKGASA